MAEKPPALPSQVDLPDDAEVFIISPTGERGTIRRHQLDTAIARGYKLEAPEQSLDATMEAEYGDSDWQAAAEGAARSLTLGASDVILGGLDEEGFRERRARNEGAALAGEIGGAILPVGGGAIAGAAGRAAGGAVRGAGATAGARIAGGVAAGATEGAIFGAGQGVSELALDERPVTVERVLSVIPSSALIGAGFGGAAGGAGALLAEGARAAKRFATSATEKMAAQADAGAATSRLPDDINAMDRPALRLAREAEVDAVKAATRKEGAQVFDDIRAFSDDARTRFVDPGDKAIAARLARTKGGVMRSLDDPRGWVDDAFQAKNTAKQLRIQEAALTESINSGRLSEGGLMKAQQWRADNQAAQARIKSFTDALSSPKSERLGAIDDAINTFGDRAAAAREAAKPGLAMGIGKAAATGGITSAAMAVGVPGLVAFPLAAALADKGVDVLLARMGRKLTKGAAEAQAKTAAGIEKFFTKAETGIRAATPAVSRALAGASFATKEMVAAKPPRPTAKSSNPRVTAFRERAAELRAVTEIAPDGKPRMTMPALREVTGRVAGVAAVAPKVADQLVMAAARRAEFLASKLPQRAGMPEVPVGPDRWQPSEMDMAKFARYIEATEDPQGVLDRMASGKMTPEDAEAFKAVYPEMYAEVQDAIMARLPELQETLPYQKRLMLSIFFDRPVDPAMDPAVLGVLQGNYANEPGTEGGTQAPPARFASLRGNNPPKPTPAQRMSE
jgi:hypothetical protein